MKSKGIGVGLRLHCEKRHGDGVAGDEVEGDDEYVLGNGFEKNGRVSIELWCVCCVKWGVEVIRSG